MGKGGGKREEGDQSIGWEHWDWSVEHCHGDGSIMMCRRGLGQFVSYFFNFFSPFIYFFFPASLK